MRLDSRQQSCEVLRNDTLFFIWRAIIDPLDVTSLFSQAREHWEQWPSVALLWDMTGAQLLPGDARRRLLDELCKLRLAATAVITRELALRVPVTMVLEVARIASPSRPPYRFFDRRAPAAEWLESVRSERMRS